MKTLLAILAEIRCEIFHPHFHRFMGYDYNGRYKYRCGHCGREWHEDADTEL